MAKYGAGIDVLSLSQLNSDMRIQPLLVHTYLRFSKFQKKFEENSDPMTEETTTKRIPIESMIRRHNNNNNTSQKKRRRKKRETETLTESTNSMRNHKTTESTNSMRSPRSVINVKRVSENFRNSLRSPSSRKNTPSSSGSRATKSSSTKKSSVKKTSSSSKPLWRHPGVTVVRGEQSPLSLKRSPARFLTSPTKSSSKEEEGEETEERHRSVSRDLDRDLAVVSERCTKRSVGTQTTRQRRNRSQSCVSSRSTKQQQTRALLSNTRDMLRNEISNISTKSSKKGKFLETLRDQLKWTESELKSARAHVVCLGESTKSWSNMSMGAVDLALRRAAQDALRSEGGVLVMKMNRRIHPFTRRREFVPRAIRIDTTSGSSPRLIYFAPSNTSKQRTFRLHSVRFGVLEGDHDDDDRISRSLRFSLSNESSNTRRILDVIFSDVSTAINSFLAIQSVLDVDTENRKTREQLQWKIAQLQVSKMLKNTMSSSSSGQRSEEDNEITELEPLFVYVYFHVTRSYLEKIRRSYTHTHIHTQIRSESCVRGCCVGVQRHVSSCIGKT